jgi:hypothetical protein
MSWADRCKAVAVSLDAFIVKHIKASVFNNALILRYIRIVPHHILHFIVSAVVIAFPITAI